VRYGAPRMGRPQRHKTVVNSHALESKLGVVSRLENSLSIASGAGEKSRRPSQNLPSTAIYCHFGAAISLRLFQSFHSLSCPRRGADQPGPKLRTVSGAVRSLGETLSTSAVCPMTVESVNSQKMLLIAHDTLIVGERNAYHIYVNKNNRSSHMKMQYTNNAKSWRAERLVSITPPFDLIFRSRGHHAVWSSIVRRILPIAVNTEHRYAEIGSCIHLVQPQSDRFSSSTLNRSGRFQPAAMRAPTPCPCAWATATNAISPTTGCSSASRRSRSSASTSRPRPNVR
jgi:hypothetical protein